MNIKFKKITIHNFLSFGHSEIDLVNKNYCIVSGENHCKKDNALSNGSGKSSIWSALSYCLTGETIQGLKNNLKNLNIDEDLCYVTLDFDIDNTTYSITRYNKPKSDLKIIVDGVDKSGKGVRESEVVLSNYLPDLTTDLIASTIIIGQGMPNKFSSFTPSGRKELLEKLTKSDFMIEDIKSKLATRISLVKDNLTNLNLDLNSKQTLLSVNNKQLSTSELQLESYNNEPDFENQLQLINQHINTYTTNVELYKDKLNNTEESIDALTNDLNNIYKDKYNCIHNLDESTKLQKDTIIDNINNLKLSIKDYNKQINDIKNIKEYCPTCKQKLLNITKPSTKPLEEKLSSCQQDLDNTNLELQAIINDYNAKLNNINANFNQTETSLNNELNRLKQLKLSYNSFLNDQTDLLNNAKQSYNNLLNKQANFYNEKQNLINQIDNYNSEINTLNTDILNLNNQINNTQDHLDILNKMNTLVKRDFRGYLLKDVINYLNIKSKEYCEIVFGTRDIELYIDGNALDISYNGKMLDNLSGGERQRIDLILQFAIRDMLCQYMNYSANIIVLDEIFDNLDKLATDKVLELISKKLYDVGSVYVISHHADELNIPYDSELIVSKNEYGISEVIK